MKKGFRSRTLHCSIFLYSVRMWKSNGDINVEQNKSYYVYFKIFKWTTLNWDIYVLLSINENVSNKVNKNFYVKSYIYIHIWLYTSYIYIYTFGSFIDIIIFSFSLFLVNSSAEWNKLKSSDREKLGIVFEDDGEFWWDYM